jgi:hypothetical protein
MSRDWQTYLADIATAYEKVNDPPLKGVGLSFQVSTRSIGARPCGTATAPSHDVRPSTRMATDDIGLVSTRSGPDNRGASLGRLTRVASPSPKGATHGSAPGYAPSDPAALRLVGPIRPDCSASAR